MKIAYAGPAGTFSEVAARHFGDPQARSGFSSVVDAVVAREVDAGVLALENAWAGAVPETLELLERSPLVVTERVEVEIRLCIATLPGVVLDQVRTARSHPHALAQTMGTLARLGFRWLPSATTAAAADELDEKTAAVCSPTAAAARGLHIHIDDAADRPGSVTRFVLLERDSVETELSLVLTERPLEGRVIGARPHPQLPFAQVFFVETEHASDRALGGYAAKSARLSS